MEEIKSQVSVAEVAKINVACRRAYLEAIHKLNEAQKKSTSHMEMKTNTILVKMAAETDLKESYDEFVAAKNRYFSFGRHLEELHVTWAYLDKKRTRLRSRISLQWIGSENNTNVYTPSPQ
ncbi:hypothetical protein Tco_0097491 [Tanacetum coccineum]